jgi:hypothetical protein
MKNIRTKNFNRNKKGSHHMIKNERSPDIVISGKNARAVQLKSINDKKLLSEKYLKPDTGKKQYVQILNPMTERYSKIDTISGSVVRHKKTKGPFKNVIIFRKGDIHDAH